MIHRRFAAIACVLLLLGGAAAGGPRKPRGEARRHLEAGMQLFERGRYEEAIGEFDAGFAVDPHPDFLYARAQALRLSGDCERAIESYQRFLESGPPVAEERLTRTNLRRCAQELAAGKASAPVPALPPATAAESRAIPRPPPVPPPPFYLDPVADALFLAGVAGAVTGVVFLVRADHHVDAANGQELLDDWHRERDAATRTRLIGGVSLAVGAAALAAGVVKWVWFPRRGPEVSASAAPGGAHLWVGGRF